MWIVARFECVLCFIKVVCCVTLSAGTFNPVAPVAQRYHVTSDTLGHEFDPGKRDFSH